MRCWFTKINCQLWINTTGKTLVLTLSASVPSFIVWFADWHNCFWYAAIQQVSSSLFPIIFDTSQLLTVFDSPSLLSRSCTDCSNTARGGASRVTFLFKSRCGCQTNWNVDQFKSIFKCFCFIGTEEQTLICLLSLIILQFIDSNTIQVPRGYAISLYLRKAYFDI